MVQIKRRWPLIVVIAAAVMVVLSLGVYFAYPYIQKKSQKDKSVSAITALKIEGQKLQSEVTEKITQIKSASSIEKNEYKGTVKLDQFAWDGIDYTSDVSGYSVDYDIQADMTAKKIGATAVLKNASQENINITAYADENQVYVQSKELYDYALTMSVKQLYETLGISDYYSESSYILSQLDTKTVAEYADVAAKILEYLNTSYNTIVEHANYTSLGSEVLNTSQGQQISVKKYQVKVTPERLSEELENAINAVYSDVKLAGYMSLFNAATGISRSTLIAGMQSSVMLAEPIEAEICVNDSNRLVRLQMASADQSDILTIEQFGAGDPWDNRIVTIESTNDISTGTKLVYECSGTAQKDIKFNLTSKAQEGNVDFVLEAVTSDAGRSCKISKLTINAETEGRKLVLAGSGSISVSSFTNMSITQNTFKNAVDAGKVIDSIMK